MNSSHQFSFEPHCAAVATADRDKIGQVLNNLISNAIKYSKSGSIININCETDQDNARVSITDEGMGIREEDIPNLFTRYFRLENNSTVSGFGIGLYLVSKSSRGMMVRFG